MIADREQLYSLQISNECGNAFDKLLLTFDLRMPVINFDDQINLCQGKIFTLNATQLFDAEYIWSTGSLQPVINITTPGTYAVTVFTDCISSYDDINITGEDCTQDIYVPTVFSPNGDGINDSWSISPDPHIIVLASKCSVMDRWGNVVFESTVLPVQWDGNSHGQPLNPAVFAYILTMTVHEGNEMRPLLWGRCPGQISP